MVQLALHDRRKASQRLSRGDLSFKPQILVPRIMLNHKWAMFPLVDQLVVVGLVRHGQRLPQFGSLFMVTSLAGSHTIFPSGLTARRTWNHMINGQFLVIKCVTAVLATEQVSQVQVVPAEFDTFLVVEVIACDSNRRNMDREMAATDHTVFVFFQHINAIQEHELDSMLPTDYAQGQNADWLVV